MDGWLRSRPVLAHLGAFDWSHDALTRQARPNKRFIEGILVHQSAEVVCVVEMKFVV